MKIRVLLLLLSFSLAACRSDHSSKSPAQTDGTSSDGGATDSSVYRLDASAQEIFDATMGDYQGLVMSNNYQTGTYTLAGGPLSDIKAGAFPTGTFAGTSEKLNFSSGIKAFECELNLPAPVVPSLSAIPLYSAMCGTIDGDVFEDIASFEVQYMGADEYRVFIYKAGGDNYTQTISGLTFPLRVGFEFSSAGTFKVYMAGADLTPLLSDNHFNPATPVILGLDFREYAANYADTTGQVISGRIITNASSGMTTSFNPSATDPFGNAID